MDFKFKILMVSVGGLAMFSVIACICTAYIYRAMKSHGREFRIYGDKQIKLLGEDHERTLNKIKDIEIKFAALAQEVVSIQRHNDHVESAVKYLMGDADAFRYIYKWLSKMELETEEGGNDEIQRSTTSRDSVRTTRSRG